MENDKSTLEPASYQGDNIFVGMIACAIIAIIYFTAAHAFDLPPFSGSDRYSRQHIFSDEEYVFNYNWDCEDIMYETYSIDDGEYVIRTDGCKCVVGVSLHNIGTEMISSIELRPRIYDVNGCSILKDQERDSDRQFRYTQITPDGCATFSFDLWRNVPSSNIGQITIDTENIEVLGAWRLS